MGVYMATTERTFGLRAAEEPDIELEVFEEPIDRLFPRQPNIVSRRGHRALKIIVRVQGSELIPPEAEYVEIDAEVFAFGPSRVGNGRHLFRHRLKWGETLKHRIQLEEGHVPEYQFEVIVRRGLEDDHLGEGPYEATIKLTPQGGEFAADEEFDPDPKVTIGFIAM